MPQGACAVVATYSSSKALMLYFSRPSRFIAALRAALSYQQVIAPRSSGGSPPGSLPMLIRYLCQSSASKSPFGKIATPPPLSGSLTSRPATPDSLASPLSPSYTSTVESNPISYHFTYIMKTRTVYAGSLMAVLTMLPGWATAHAADQSAATAPTGRSRTTTPEQFAQLRWDISQKGREIDLSRYKRTFQDDFKTLDIVKDNSDSRPRGGVVLPGPRRLQDQRAPESGRALQAGRRRSSPPRREGRKTVARRLHDHREHPRRGLCPAVRLFRDDGRVQLPSPGPERIADLGAFWLKSQCDYFNNGTTTRTEIDINEFYGDDGYHVTGHLWPAAQLSPDATITKHIFCSGHKNKIAPHLFKNLKVDGVVKGFHCYGGEVTPQWVIMYFDRKELARFPTMEEWKTPLYMLVDLVITKSEEEAVFPMDLTVKNVSAYQPLQPYKGQ